MADPRKVARRRVSIISAYQSVFGTPSGEKVLADLMATHYFAGSTFDPKHPELTVFREGERNVVLRIAKMLKLNPKDLYERIVAHEKSLE